jgi:methionyl-tRNA formyltransferase
VRIVYAGTPEFAATGLQALVRAGLDIALVLCQPDRAAGRGQQLRAGPVKALALAQGIPVLQPVRLRPRAGEAPAPDTLEALDRLRAARADVLVVAAYGLLLPPEVLGIPGGIADAGCGPVRAVNIHASLLPRWRGAAPVARAIEAGDPETGVTIMQMDAGLDTGPMLLREATAIGPGEAAGELTERLADLGARMCVQALADLQGGRLRAQVQSAGGVLYAAKILKDEGRVDWSLDAVAIERRMRAFDPFPGLTAQAGGVPVKLWRGQVVGGPDGEAPGGPVPGTVLASSAEGIDFACGRGRLRVTQLQRPGGRRLAAREFLQGFAVPVGVRWER